MVTPSNFIVLIDISAGIGQEKEGGVLRKLIVVTVDFKGLTLKSLATALSDINSKISIGLLVRFWKHVSKAIKSSTNFYLSGKSTPRLFIMVRNKIGPDVHHYKLGGVRENIHVFDDLCCIRKDGGNYSY